MKDKIVFSDGVLRENAVFTRDGSTDDLMITLSTGEVLRVQDQFEAFSSGPFGVIWFDRIETFEFADETIVTDNEIMDLILETAKTSGDDDVYGFMREDVLDGGAGNDRLEGGDEGDTYIWGRGWDDDTVYDMSDAARRGRQHRQDRLLGGHRAVRSSVHARTVGTDDLVITIGDTGETLTIEDQFLKFALGIIFTEIEEFRFDNGTVWTPGDIREMLLEQATTAGDDTINGFHTVDMLDGGAGNDRWRARAVATPIFLAKATNRMSSTPTSSISRETAPTSSNSRPILPSRMSG